ncbi:MAG TPA: FG-GAP-like repeat-containing protein, partial [Thermoanaerobaculia bacterium]|nr:FG-GAP-like repeat-containing protein [Thermoanaerobaculia bacterium]
DVYYDNAIPIFDLATDSPVQSGSLIFPGAERARCVAERGGLAFLGTQTSGGGTLWIGRYLQLDDDAGIAPSVAITTPVSDATLLERQWTAAEATATDDIAVRSVELFRDGVSLGIAYAAPYRLRFQVPIGVQTMTLTAVAEDYAGNRTTSEPVVVQVHPNPNAVVELLAPRIGSSVVEGTSLALVADVTDERPLQAVEFWIDQQLVSSQTTPPFHFSYAVPRGSGDFNVRAIARDDLGSIEPAPVLVHVLRDAPPVVVIAKPSDPTVEVLPGSILEVLVTAQDDVRVDAVSLLLNGAAFGSAPLPASFFDVPVPIGAREMTLRATATDSYGQVAQSASITIPIADSDPGTAAVGTVVDTTQTPVSGAAVTCGGVSGTSGGNGAFSIAGIPGALGQITCTANATNATGHRLTGRSLPMAAVVGGTTAMGQIVLRPFSGYLFSGPRIKLQDPPRSVGVGDFDGDGKADLVVSRTGSPQGIVELFKVGDDGLYHSVSVRASPSYGAMEVADLNRDGRLDVAVAPENGFSLATHLGNGNGTFQTNINTLGDYHEKNTNNAAGDLNRDAVMDLVVGGLPLIGRGDGSFVRNFGTGGYYSGVALGDVNGDGILDYAGVREDPLFGPSAYSVSLGVGDGTFLGGTFQSLSGLPHALAIADFTGDGNADLVVRRLFPPELVLIEGHGDGTFADPTPFPPRFQTSTGQRCVLRAADLNADGRPDLVTCWFSDITVLLNEGGGQFGPQQAYGVGDSPGDVRIADLDADGIPDVVTANRNTGGGTTRDLSILYGLGAGLLDSYQATTAGTRPTSVAVGDLDGDGHLDVVVADDRRGSFVASTVNVLLGRGDGTLMAPVAYPLGGALAGFTSAALAVKLADVDRDGKLDVLAVVDNSVAVFSGVGDGTLASPALYPVGTTPNDLVVADLDGDAALDVLTVNLGSQDASLLYGSGNGTLATEQRLQTGGAWNAAVADLNGDGRTDLALTGGSSVALFLGQGGRSFIAGAVLPVGSSPTSIRLGDLNGDAKIDIVASNSDSGDVSVLLGTGGGAFAPQVRYSVRYGGTQLFGNSLALDLFDADRDGKLDLAVTSIDDRTVSLFLGAGDGTLKAPQVFGAGRCPQRVVSGDVNGDSLPELIVTNECAGTANLNILTHR